MRRKDREVLDAAAMYAILSAADELYIAFNTQAAPYVLAVNVVLFEGSLYFHCAKEGRKLDCLSADPRVGFTAAVDVYVEGSTTRYRSVCGHGLASLVEDDMQKNRVLCALAERFAAPCPLPVPAHDVARTALVRIDIVEMTGKQSLSPLRDGEDHARRS